MKKLILSGVLLSILSSSVCAKEVKQTICFSKADCSSKYTYATIGDKVNLCGGACDGKTLEQMNKEGWKLTQVIGNLNMAFGMLLTKEK